jgi:predicted ATPase
MQAPSVFVTRENELAVLNTYLDQTLLGKGQICFISGEPGQGKTVLALEFARRAQKTHPALVVAAGLCDPQTGQGDPYLPFRTILQTLTDTNSQLHNQQVARWQSVVQASTEALLDWGPDLIGTFVPGAALAAKIGSKIGKQTSLSDKLGKWVGKGQAGAAAPVEQNQIFQQYVNVITKLSTHAPLLLILDDAQWADSSSIDLLFYLVRRMQDSRILLVVIYRETELELGRHGDRHPLLKVVVEAKRYLGHITLDLAHSQSRAFVDAYLDTEPNHLDEAFRAALFRHTGGHALFVVELLRAMQERGDLVQDEAGHWQVGPTLDWATLPGRTEAVIQERVSRLPDDLRQLLQTASVQGDSFAGEVVAQVQAVEVRPTVQRLNSELVRRHRLLLDQGQERVGLARLSHFTFQNKLFQHYLYHALNQAERSYLHEDSARAMEAMYGDEVGRVAVQLAWHYTEAGLTEQARTYLYLAGQQAAAAGVHPVAADYFSQALALTSEADGGLRFELLLAREAAYNIAGQREAQRADLEALAGLAASLNSPLPQSDAALRRAYYELHITGDYAKAVAAAQQALAYAEHAGDVARQAAARRLWGVALARQGVYDAAREQLAPAVSLARQAGDGRTEADALNSLASVALLVRGEQQTGLSLFQEALVLYRRLGDRVGECTGLNNLGYALLG